MHQLEDPDLSCQPCRLVFVETLRIAKFDQEVRCFGHSPPYGFFQIPRRAQTFALAW